MAQLKPVIRPVQRPVPLRQSVYDALVNLIASGDLEPGEHLVETDLAGSARG
jgi:DNA-binding GntR family transcriptional regulator